LKAELILERMDRAEGAERRQPRATRSWIILCS